MIVVFYCVKFAETMPTVNELWCLISSAPRRNHSTSQNVQHLYDKFPEKLIYVYDRVYPTMEIVENIVDIPKPHVTFELKNLNKVNQRLKKCFDKHFKNYSYMFKSYTFYIP